MDARALVRVTQEKALKRNMIVCSPNQAKPNRSPIVYFDMTEMLALKSKVIRGKRAREREIKWN